MSRPPAPKEKEGHNRLPINPRVHVILSAEAVANGARSNWQKMEITGGVTNLGLTVCQMSFLQALFINDNKLATLPPAINMLVDLESLDISNNIIEYLPHELGDLVKIKVLLANNNRLYDLPLSLGKLFNITELNLCQNPLSVDINNLYYDKNGVNKLLTFLQNNLVDHTPPPPDRQWLHLAEPISVRPVCHFSVMCYNVLCDKYATRQMYGYCPPWALDWEYRKKGIMAEILKYSTDIITLQEVETNAFYNFFLPELKHMGYDGIFSPKSRARHMGESEKKYVDGCAIFYKTNMFTLVKEHLVEFNKLAMDSHDGSEDMLNRVMPKDNIGLAAHLQTKPGAWSQYSHPPDKAMEKQNLLVCTAHIHWDPEYCDVKLIQTIMLMTEIRRIVDSISSEETATMGVHRRQAFKANDQVHLLLCGDLNSLPHSGVVEYLTAGQVAMEHQDFKGFKGYKASLHKLAELNKQALNPTMYMHNFRLKQSYQDEVMENTNYTYEFKGVIDYIFHSSDSMITVAALGPIDTNWFKENKVVGCPHPHIPSDHFPLVVQMELIPANDMAGALKALQLNSGEVTSRQGHHQQQQWTGAAGQSGAQNHHHHHHGGAHNATNNNGNTKGNNNNKNNGGMHR